MSLPESLNVERLIAELDESATGLRTISAALANLSAGVRSHLTDDVKASLLASASQLAAVIAAMLESQRVYWAMRQVQRDAVHRALIGGAR